MKCNVDYGKLIYKAGTSFQFQRNKATGNQQLSPYSTAGATNVASFIFRTAFKQSQSCEDKLVSSAPQIVSVARCGQQWQLAAPAEQGVRGSARGFQNTLHSHHKTVHHASRGHEKS